MHIGERRPPTVHRAVGRQGRATAHQPTLRPIAKPDNGACAAAPKQAHGATTPARRRPTRKVEKNASSIERGNAAPGGHDEQDHHRELGERHEAGEQLGVRHAERSLERIRPGDRGARGATASTTAATTTAAEYPIPMPSRRQSASQARRLVPERCSGAERPPASGGGRPSGGGDPAGGGGDDGLGRVRGTTCHSCSRAGVPVDRAAARPRGAGELDVALDQPAQLLEARRGRAGRPRRGRR